MASRLAAVVPCRTGLTGSTQEWQAGAKGTWPASCLLSNCNARLLQASLAGACQHLQRMSVLCDDMQSDLMKVIAMHTLGHECVEVCRVRRALENTCAAVSDAPDASLTYGCGLMQAGAHSFHVMCAPLHWLSLNPPSTALLNNVQHGNMVRHFELQGLDWVSAI